MKNLYAILLLVGTCCAQSTGSGSSVIFGDFIDGISGAQAEDIPLPNFAAVDGSPLQLPIGVNPLAYLSVGAPTHTVYIGDTAHGCPKAPGSAGSTSQSYCTYASQNSGGAFDDFTALNAVTSAWDGTYWDVWVTHGSRFDSSAAWIWPYVGATGWLVFHSDCTQASPCTGTNDLGYNPRGRQVCSHGSMDQLTNPALPNMGWRNHGCMGSVLGFPSSSASVPVTAAAYSLTNQTGYDDLANMWTVSSSSNGVVNGSFCSGAPVSSSLLSLYCSTSGGPSLGSVIQMGWAAVDSPTSTACYGAPCPVDGINHIGIQDAAIVADATGNNIYPVGVKSTEWVVNPAPNAPPFINAFAAAAPHDIFFDEDLFQSDADDNGFGANSIASEITAGCARCSFNHNYFDGIKRDAGEGHVISLAPPGPYQVVDNWVEGNTVGLWTGGSTPPYFDTNGNPILTQNVERARNRLTYNPRWLNDTAIGGANVASWTCSGTGPLVVTTKSTVPIGETSGGIYYPTIWVQLPNESGTTAQNSGVLANWYTADSFTACSGSCTITIPTITLASGYSGCASGGGAVTDSISDWGGVAGFRYGVSTGTASVLNAINCGPSSPCNPLFHMSPQYKNRSEFKEAQAVWIDGELWETSGIGAQEGQLLSMSVRACSGNSKCQNGQTQDINNFAITNSIGRHAVAGMFRDARSEGGGISCWGDTSTCKSSNGSLQNLSAVACDGGANNVVDFTYATAPNILNAPGASGSCTTGGTITCTVSGTPTMTGTDVYVYNVGSDLAPLLPNGWYQTLNIAYGKTIPIIIPAANGTCTAGNAYSTQATLLGTSGGNGEGVSFGMHHGVTQNNLLYDIGNHNLYGGSGADVASFTSSSGGNAFAVNVTMGPAAGTHCTSAGQAAGSIGAVACAYVTAITACPAATYPPNGQDCPLLLQAEKGDLMQVECPANTGFDTNAPVLQNSGGTGGGAPSGVGTPIIDLDLAGQQWFTYVPTGATCTGSCPGYTPDPTTGAGNPPAAGHAATCPLEPPQPGAFSPLSTDVGSSGVYNHQSYPKTQWFAHNTAVGINGMRVYGGSYETDITWENNLFGVPGPNDVLPTNAGLGTTQYCVASGGTAGCGFTFPGSDAFSGASTSPCPNLQTNATGITNMGDPATLTFFGNALAGGNLVNYPMWQSDSSTCTGSSYVANGNSTPTNTATPGAGVTCNGGLACSQTNYLPDSIGFLGSMGTTAFPLNLSDWRQYGLDPSSPYKAGGIYRAGDGLDNGIIPGYIANAFARTIRPCPLASGCPTYYHDGPQYEWLTWTCTGTCSSFNVYEDGTLVLTTANLYAQVYGLAVNSSHTWNVTSASGSVSGLTSQMY